MNANFAGLPPIELPDGRKLETLADCRAYILIGDRRQGWRRYVRPASMEERFWLGFN